MIKQNQIVALTYEMYVDGGEKNEIMIEQATTQQPLTYCHGIGMMLPKFEQELETKQEGDEFDFVIEAKDAYGDYQDEAVMTLNREMFEIDGKFDSERVFIGNIIPMTTVEGQIVNAQVVNITDKDVTIDLNHPYAGENLHFKGKILLVRDATAEELEQLQNPHCGCKGGCKNGNCGNGNNGEGCNNEGCCGNCD